MGVEPQNSPVISQHLAGKPIAPGPHKIQGIGAGFIPDTLDLSMVDRVELVTNEESIEMARRLAKEEGILCGISCGAAVAVAVRLGKLPEFAGKTIVTVLPDAPSATSARRSLKVCSMSNHPRFEVSGRVWVIGVSAPAVVTGI